jgi:hypothetical protein
MKGNMLMSNEKGQWQWSLKKVYFKIAMPTLLMCSVMLYGCTSVPSQVTKTHQKELEIIESLQSTHLAMVDAYVDQKLQNFESFFFKEYGPAYFSHWIESFKTLNNRDYDPSRDFPILYNDLVAEYQAESKPIEKIRFDLKVAIQTEYRNAIDAHNAVGRWLESLKELNESQRKAIDSLLAAIKPGLSLDSIDKTIATAKENIEKRIEELSKM